MSGWQLKQMAFQMQTTFFSEQLNQCETDYIVRRSYSQPVSLHTSSGVQSPVPQHGPDELDLFFTLASTRRGQWALPDRSVKCFSWQPEISLTRHNLRFCNSLLKMRDEKYITQAFHVTHPVGNSPKEAIKQRFDWNPIPFIYPLANWTLMQKSYHVGIVLSIKSY